MNTRLLRSTVRVMCKKKLINMDKWQTEGPCGTVGCIAGTRVLLDAARKGRAPRPIKFRPLLPNTWEVAAAKRLGLTQDQANSLFYATQWPSEFKEAYYNARTTAGRGRAIRAAVEDFIRNKGEWSWARNYD